MIPRFRAVAAASGNSRGKGTSFACDIARDGRRISIYPVGPNRIRACAWDRAGDGWEARALPQKSRLGSNVVAISDDGARIAAVDVVVACLWSQGLSGTRTRQVIAGSGAMVPRAVNDAGTVIGVRFTDDGRTHAVV